MFVVILITIAATMVQYKNFQLNLSSLASSLSLLYSTHYYKKNFFLIFFTVCFLICWRKCFYAWISVTLSADISGVWFEKRYLIFSILVKFLVYEKIQYSVCLFITRISRLSVSYIKCLYLFNRGDFRGKFFIDSFLMCFSLLLKILVYISNCLPALFCRYVFEFY